MTDTGDEKSFLQSQLAECYELLDSIQSASLMLPVINVQDTDLDSARFHLGDASMILTVQIEKIRTRIKGLS